MLLVGMYCFFFFKQKTAYELRISDWSSDVCSSDLPGGARLRRLPGLQGDDAGGIRGAAREREASLARGIQGGDEAANRGRDGQEAGPGGSQRPLLRPRLRAVPLRP